MNAATFGLVFFIDESEAFATRFADFAAEEDERFARAPLMFPNLPFNGGESDNREPVALMDLARKIQSADPEPELSTIKPCPTEKREIGGALATAVSPR